MLPIERSPAANIQPFPQTYSRFGLINITVLMFVT